MERLAFALYMIVAITVSGVAFGEAVINFKRQSYRFSGMLFSTSVIVLVMLAEVIWR